jgi:hypothetical protein
MGKEEDKLLNQISDKKAELTKEIFERMGLHCIALDTQKREKGIKCIDYLVRRETDQYEFLCEVKTIHSAYYDKTYGRISSTMAAVATEEQRRTVLQPDTVYRVSYREKLEATLKKIRAVLEYARGQVKSLVKMEPCYKGHPFVVALFFDPFVDEFDRLRDILPEYPEINAVLKRSQSCELNRRSEEIDHIFETAGREHERGEPQSQIQLAQWDEEHWHYIVNASASNRFDPKRLGICPHDQFFKG